jgi:flagellar biogenesis protein FliO
MLDTLFAMPLAVRFFIAFIVVLALIAVTAWLVRRFAANRLGGGGARGRQPRLAVIEAANVDARRRLLLIRRDNMEHLLMIGGPTDIVVEPNIVRAPISREPSRADNTWPLQPVNELPARAHIGEDQWQPEMPARARTPETRAGMSAPLSPRPSPELAPASPKPEQRTPAAPIDNPADHNLAEMANQLEAALRREPSKSSEPPRPPREIKMRIDPRIESRTEPKIENRPEPKLDIRPEPKIDAPAAPKPLFTPGAPEPKREPKLDMKPEPISPKPEAKPEPASRQDFYDNLEEEMASLLGRQPGKS